MSLNNKFTGKNIVESFRKGSQVLGDIRTQVENNKTFRKGSQILGDIKTQVEDAKKKHQRRDAEKYKDVPTNKGSYYNDIIFQRLEIATEAEIRKICEALKVEYFPSIPIGYLSKEYRQAAGHSMANLTRSSHSLPYKRILIDIADKLKPGIGWTNFKMDDEYTEEEIENKIFEFMTIRFEEQFQKLPEKDKREVEDLLSAQLQKNGLKQTTINATIAALSSGGLGVALAGTAASTIFAQTALIGTLSNILFGTGAVIYSSSASSVAAVYLAPTASQVILCGTGVGVIIAVPLLAATLGGPAYRKTIPATLQMIVIRKRHEAELAEDNPN